MNALAPVLTPAEHPVAAYLARLGSGSRRTMATCAETLARIASSGRVGALELQWHVLDYAYTQAIRQALAARYKPATANKHLACLRGLLRACWRLGTMPDARYHRAVDDLKAIEGTTELAGRALSSAEVEQLFLACDDSLRGLRDRALLACLYGAGLRRTEACALDAVRIGPDGLLVQGKRHRERTVPLAPKYLAHVEAWRRNRGSGALFTSFTRDGALTSDRLTSDGVYAIVGRIIARAGLAHATPHDLRRTYLTHLLSRGADVLVVSALAGHANPAVTKRYDRRGLEAKQQAVALLES